MIAIIFFSFAIFVWGMIYQSKAKTDQEHNTAFLTIMFGMVSLITLELIVVVGHYK